MLSVVSLYTLKADNPHSTLPGHDFITPLTGIERKYWMSTEIGRLGGYGFQDTVTAGDGSNQKGGEMEAGY